MAHHSGMNQDRRGGALRSFSLFECQSNPSVPKEGNTKTKQNHVRLIQAVNAAAFFSGFVRFLSGGSAACLDHLVFSAAVWLREEFLLFFLPSFLPGTQKCSQMRFGEQPQKSANMWLLLGTTAGDLTVTANVFLPSTPAFPFFPFYFY